MKEDTKKYKNSSDKNAEQFFNRLIKENDEANDWWEKNFLTLTLMKRIGKKMKDVGSDIQTTFSDNILKRCLERNRDLLNSHNEKHGLDELIELTDAEIQQIERLASTMTIKGICYIMNLTTKSFERIRNRDSRAMNAFERGRAIVEKNAGQGLLAIMQAHSYDVCEGDEEKTKNGKKILKRAYSRYSPSDALTARIFYLKTQCGWRETERKKVVEKEEKEKPVVVNVHYPKEPFKAK
jgi:hypothetical protein